MTNLAAYYCPRCCKNWLIDCECQVSCAVRHAPDECCHYGEREVTVEVEGAKVTVHPA